MLTREENELLTRVERGTPCGELLRRYWHPIAAAGEFTEQNAHQAGQDSKAKNWLFTATSRANTDWSASIVRIAWLPWPMGESMRREFGVRIMVGNLTAPANAWNNPQNRRPARSKKGSNTSLIR